MPKLIVLASRHPASTVKVVIFGVAIVPKQLVLASRHPASTVKSHHFLASRRRNGAETTSFGFTTPRVHCKSRHLRIEMLPTLLVFSDHPPTPRGSSVTKRNGAETINLSAETITGAPLPSALKLYQHRPQTAWAEIHGLNSCKLCFFRNAHCAISCEWLLRT